MIKEITFNNLDYDVALKYALILEHIDQFQKFKELFNFLLFFLISKPPTLLHHNQKGGPGYSKFS